MTPFKFEPKKLHSVALSEKYLFIVWLLKNYQDVFCKIHEQTISLADNTF